MKLFSLTRHAWALFAVAAVSLPSVSCRKEAPVDDAKPEVTLELLTIGDTSAEFSVVTKNADYFTWSLTGEGQEGKEIKVEESRYETSVSDLAPATEYVLTVTAWKGEFSAEASETFTTSVNPAVAVGSVSFTHNSVKFTLTPSYATSLYWAVKEKGSEVAESDWTKLEASGNEPVEISCGNLLPETSYTISAYAANGDKAGSVTEENFTTTAEPYGNDHITVSFGAGAAGICVEVICGNMDGKKYYANLFSPSAEVYDYDSGEYYHVDSKEAFLKYVKSNMNYLGWASLYGDTSKYAWLERDAEGNSVEPDSDYLVYALTFTEDASGNVTSFDEDSIIEIAVHTAAADVIGEGSAVMDFTVEAGGDVAEVKFSGYDDVVAYASGHVTDADVQAAGGIEAYVAAKFADYLYFNTMDYFDPSTQLRSLTPSTDYWYYTLCYGKDGKLGAVNAKEFTTTGLEFSSDYTCTVEIIKMSGTEASFTMHSDNCTQGRWCNVTAEEFESEYGGDLAKLVSAKLASNRAEQVFSDSKAYIYGLESGKDYVLAVLPLGGDMSTVYGTPVMEKYTFNPAE